MDDRNNRAYLVMNTSLAGRGLGLGDHCIAQKMYASYLHQQNNRGSVRLCGTVVNDHHRHIPLAHRSVHSITEVRLIDSWGAGLMESAALVHGAVFIGFRLNFK